MDKDIPAFPVPFTRFETWCHGKIPVHGFPGMSLRDYFAGQALAGMCANDARGLEESARRLKLTPAQTLTSVAYDLADTMLAEREKRKASQ